MMTLNDFSCHESLSLTEITIGFSASQCFPKLITCRVTLPQFGVNVKGPEQEGCLLKTKAETTSGGEAGVHTSESLKALWLRKDYEELFFLQLPGVFTH